MTLRQLQMRKSKYLYQTISQHRMLTSLFILLQELLPHKLSKSVATPIVATMIVSHQFCKGPDDAKASSNEEVEVALPKI